MLKIILGIVAALLIAVAGILGYAALQPDDFRIARSTTIKAPPETIYPLMSDFRRGAEWSPYEKKDPNMKRSFSGPASGKGAIYNFDGNSDVGTGRLEITEATPPSKVVLRLDMVKPFEGSNIIEYSILPKGNGPNVTSEVTWSMHGQQPLLAKAICLFFNMDKMVGADFEQGLASLKAVAEK
jgi:uncharacterized protein YndB with AHSA1/START domain